MSKLFQSEPECKELRLSIGQVCMRPLMVSHAHLFEDIQKLEGNPVEQHVKLAMLMKELLCDTDGNPFEDLKDMSAKEIVEKFPMTDFILILRELNPEVVDPNGN